MSYGDQQTRRPPQYSEQMDPFRDIDRRLQALEYQSQTGIDRGLMHGGALHKLREDLQRLSERQRESIEQVRTEQSAIHNRILLALVTVLGGAMFSAFSGLIFKAG